MAAKYQSDNYEIKKQRIKISYVWKAWICHLKLEERRSIWCSCKGMSVIHQCPFGRKLKQTNTADELDWEEVNPVFVFKLLPPSNSSEQAKIKYNLIVLKSCQEFMEDIEMSSFVTD